jgi:hypothetical protein
MRAITTDHSTYARMHLPTVGMYGDTEVTVVQTHIHIHMHTLSDSSECSCGTGNQTVDHLIYECPKLQKEREVLIKSVIKKDTWPRKK